MISKQHPAVQMPTPRESMTDWPRDFDVRALRAEQQELLENTNHPRPASTIKSETLHDA